MASLGLPVDAEAAQVGTEHVGAEVAVAGHAGQDREAGVVAEQGDPRAAVRGAVAPAAPGELLGAEEVVRALRLAPVRPFVGPRQTQMYVTERLDAARSGWGRGENRRPFPIPKPAQTSQSE